MQDLVMGFVERVQVSHTPVMTSVLSFMEREKLEEEISSIGQIYEFVHCFACLFLVINSQHNG